MAETASSYSISRIALKCAKEYRLPPRDALHAACCEAYGIREMATNDGDFKRVCFLNFVESKSDCVVADQNGEGSASAAIAIRSHITCSANSSPLTSRRALPGQLRLQQSGPAPAPIVPPFPLGTRPQAPHSRGCHRT